MELKTKLQGIYPVLNRSIVGISAEPEPGASRGNVSINNIV